MEKLKVIQIDEFTIEFQGGIKLYSDHNQDCCENHYLEMKDLTMSDFDGLEFDLSTDNFFKRIPDYGIELIPVKGHSVKIPGYAYNNGYYNSNLDLVLKGPGFERRFDISECQKDNY